MVATKLEKVTGGGLSYRYSGHRFGVVFPVKFVDETIPHLESLRKGVEIYSFILRGPKRPREKPANPEKYKGAQKRISLTVAIGAVVREDPSVKPKYVIKSAEQALLNVSKSLDIVFLLALNKRGQATFSGTKTDCLYLRTVRAEKVACPSFHSKKY
jgi:GGDEF domain-containing protein